MKRTPLYNKHLESKGKLIDFGGWELPVEYSGIKVEHNAVRNEAGLFDVSHMGEIIVTGDDAEIYIQKIVTNDISSLKDYQICYTVMCYPDGGVVDDFLIYKYNNKKYLLVVNASNTDKDFEWLKSHIFGDVKIENISSNYALLALQGPFAQEILQKITDKNLDEIEYYHFADPVMIQDIRAMVSRTGYTGEDGFEIYFDPEKAPMLWDLLLDTGKEKGLVPAGLGARDTLRFEAALPLYGQELGENITPYEAGLGFCVKLSKKDFISKEALAKQKAEGVKRKIVGFEMIERGIPRHNYEVYKDGNKIGYVTTGSVSPTLNKNIGLALIEAGYTEIDTEIDIVIRNKNVKAKVVKKPFYSRKNK